MFLLSLFETVDSNDFDVSINMFLIEYVAKTLESFVVRGAVFGIEEANSHA